MEKKYKILYHHRTLGDGAEGIHIKSISDCLRDMGHTVRIISLIGEKTNTPTKDVKKWEWVKKIMPQILYQIAEIFYNIPGFFMIRRTIKEMKPDFIYDRYAHYSFAAIWASKVYKIPLILEVNSPYAIQKKLWEKLYLPKLSSIIERHIFKAADAVIVVSSVLKKILLDYGVEERKITVLPNGTNLKRFDPNLSGEEVRKKYDATDAIVLGFVGILRKWHNIEFLLDVLTEMNLPQLKVKMLFIGDGPILPDLLEIVKDKNLENFIYFTGRIPHEKMPEYIAALDIAISPHATFYSSPMKILEYMAMEKAIIAPNMQNIRDLIKDGYNGILFKPNNKTDLSQKLFTLIKDEKLRKTLGKHARETVENYFTWEKNARKTIEIAQKLLQRKFDN